MNKKKYIKIQYHRDEIKKNNFQNHIILGSIKIEYLKNN